MSGSSFNVENLTSGEKRDCAAGAGDFPRPDFGGADFWADLLSNNMVSGAKVAFPPPQQVRFYMANLALTFVNSRHDRGVRLSL